MNAARPCGRSRVVCAVLLGIVAGVQTAGAAYHVVDTIHLGGGLPMGSAKDLNTAKAEFKTAWKALKAGTRA